MLRKVVEDFLEEGPKVAKYREALRLLKEAGFLDLLRKFGYVNVIDSGNNPTAMATEAGRSHGFQSAVSHLEFFMEMYAYKKDSDKQVVPNFGAEKILIKEKLMTKEELDKILGGKI